MPTKEKPKATWVEWQPEGAPMPELLPHAELLARLRDQGIELSSSALEYYRYQNILPRPIRRRFEGLTQPLYPDWFVPAIEHLRYLQAQGASLDEIRPRLREWVRALILTRIPWQDPLAEPTATLDAAIRAYVAALQPWEGASRIGMVKITFFDDAGNELPDFRHDVNMPIDSGFD